MDKRRDIAIEVRNISKTFPIPDGYGGNGFQALDQISFTLHRGEVMCVVGSNGSGKSTLLKILGEVIKPSSGEAVIYGNITSILNVGDNFHPDLSGRENVNIQLRLHRFSKNRFESFHQKIKEFSEIGDFYEQPVKIYSDGMFLRLAFSVALQLSSDILLLDEVLSVGDEGFQLKCKEQLSLLAAEGKTILFVSHNRNEILELATRCLWLHQGKLKREGPPAEILGEYFLMHKDHHNSQKKIENVSPFLTEDETGIRVHWPKENAPSNEVMSIRHISISPADGNDRLSNTSPISLKFVVDKHKSGIRIGPFFVLQDMFYQPVMVGHFLNNLRGEELDLQTKDTVGLLEISCVIPSHFLIPGQYYLGLRFGMEENEWHERSEGAFWVPETLGFTIHPGPNYADYVGDPGKGVVRPMLDWNMVKQ